MTKRKPCVRSFRVIPEVIRKENWSYKLRERKLGLGVQKDLGEAIASASAMVRDAPPRRSPRFRKIMFLGSYSYEALKSAIGQELKVVDDLWGGERRLEVE